MIICASVVCLEDMLCASPLEVYFVLGMNACVYVFWYTDVVHNVMDILSRESLFLSDEV